MAPRPRPGVPIYHVRLKLLNWILLIQVWAFLGAGSTPAAVKPVMVHYLPWFVAPP